MTAQLRFGPGVPGREALGAKTLEDFLGSGAGLEEEERMELVREDAARSLLRYPLPGTPREDGKLTGSPRGAGTGWVRLARYRGAGFLEALRARFTAPRSESLAAREWNLLCVLRANGVGTPEPLAVGGTAQRSFLVTRELSKVDRLSDWLASQRDAEERRKGLTALGAFLGRLLRSGVRLPDLDCDALFIGRRKEPCSNSEEPVADRRVRRLPPIFLEEVRGGGLGKAPGARESAVRLQDLFQALPPKARPGERESYAVFVRALRGSSTKSERKELWREFARKLSRADHQAAERDRLPRS